MHKVKLFDDYTCRHVDKYPQPGLHCGGACDPHPCPAQTQPSLSYSRVSVLLNTLRSGSINTPTKHSYFIHQLLDRYGIKY